MDRAEIEDALFLIMKDTVQQIEELSFEAEDEDDIAFIFSSARRIIMEELDLEE